MGRARTSAACDTRHAMRYDERPTDPSPLTTSELPDTPVRDRNIPARAWVDAPTSLLGLGDDLPDRPEPEYKRRIGPWILWRSGPARRGHARYWACHSDDLDRSFTFRIFPDGTGSGVGPSGATVDRFRAWKEDLRDSV